MSISYRALDMNDDSTFCSGKTFFLTDSVAAVAQLVKTTLRLLLGEWFLDTSVGVAYLTKVVGTGNAANRDPIIRAAILGVSGVTGIVNYTSSVANRNFTVSAVVSTIYGPVDLNFTLPPPLPVPPANYLTDGSGNVLTDFLGNIITAS